MEQIKIDDGRKKYLVTNMEGEEIGVISVDPKDFNFIKRADKASEVIESKIREASKVSQMIKDKESEADIADVLSDIDDSIKKEMNTLFDYDVSSIFGNVHCLSFSNGKTFIERFMEAVLPIIKAGFEEEKKASEKRRAKYQANDHLEMVK